MSYYKPFDHIDRADLCLEDNTFLYVYYVPESPAEEVAETTIIGEELKYHITKYTFLSNKQTNKLPV